MIMGLTMVNDMISSNRWMWSVCKTEVQKETYILSLAKAIYIQICRRKPSAEAQIVKPPFKE
jgi:hypothetical protein